jgi:hypothetical protein
MPEERKLAGLVLKGDKPAAARYASRSIIDPPSLRAGLPSVAVTLLCEVEGFFFIKKRNARRAKVLFSSKAKCPKSEGSRAFVLKVIVDAIYELFTSVRCSVSKKVAEMSTTKICISAKIYP